MAKKQITKNINPRMFDVLPCKNKDGIRHNFVLNKKNSPAKIFQIQMNRFVPEKESIPSFIKLNKVAYKKRNPFRGEVPRGKSFQKFTNKKSNYSNDYFFKQKVEPISIEEKDLLSEDNEKNERFLFFWSKLALKPAISFASVALGIFLLFFIARFAFYGFQKKEAVVVLGENAISQMLQAKESVLSKDFDKAQSEILTAVESLEMAKTELEKIGARKLSRFSFLPFFSKISTGNELIGAGENIALATINVTNALEKIHSLENPLSQENDINLGEVIVQISDEILLAKEKISLAFSHLEKVNPDDLPKEHQEIFQKIIKSIDDVLGILNEFEKNQKIIYEIMGFNGPRKYLFLFQNNHEMRATGGFIGSYGLLDVNDGKIRNLLIDGIFNPDGQLKEKVVPPEPIQKISAAWSTHDANWFPHFPTSARKIAWFYEKTGGATVDGVITITPVLMQKLLSVVGPIEMKEYGVTLDENNFIEKVQNEVEIEYDKELNQPKKILADLAPKILEKIFSTRDGQEISKIFDILVTSLTEKHILLFSFDDEIQKIISAKNWTGEIKQTKKDFLMVVNSNINGYKTDGIIDETITHKAQISPDGSIINTVKIKRVHNGGNADYRWWNKVNSNYMRVYVPLGSKLIDAKGHTLVHHQPPLDYEKLNFVVDEDVANEEKNIFVDEKTGTKIYNEEEKTVFANWTYVSPQETLEIEYTYLLPFKVDFNKNKEDADSYSILFQKQSGSVGSKIETEIAFPQGKELVWSYPQIENESLLEKNIFAKQDLLSKDIFYGLIFQTK